MKIRRILNAIVNGVTKPQEITEALYYVSEIFNKDVSAMKEYVGTKDMTVEGISKATMNKVSEVLKLVETGKMSKIEGVVEIKMLTTVRDLLITISKEGEEASLKDRN